MKVGTLFKHVSLEEGAVIGYENRIWRVGLVNECRARLDPVTGIVTTVDAASGRSINSYGGSINISPTSSHLKEVNIMSLDDAALRRLCRLQEAADIESRSKVERRNRDSQLSRAVTAEPDDIEADDEDAMSDVESEPEPPQQKVKPTGKVKGSRVETQEVVQKSKAVAPPVAVKSKAELNKAKLAAIAKKKGVVDEKGKVKAGGAKKEKVAKEPKPCKCGCGEVTGGYFVPGHDARFKGWMLKIERGKAKKNELLTPAVIAQYKWAKVAGGGERTTTNYKGEAHTGYDKAAQ